MRKAIATVKRSSQNLTKSADRAWAEVAAYLPRNYRIVEVSTNAGTDTVEVTIWGEDHAGWTLDGYVIPRLASGLIFAVEYGQEVVPS